MTKREKIGLAIFFLIWIMAVGYFGYSYVFYSKLSEEMRNYSSSLVKWESDSRRYLSEKYGFSLNYPGGWTGHKEEEMAVDSKNKYLFRLSLGMDGRATNAATEGIYVFVYSNGVCIGNSNSTGKKFIVSDSEDMAAFLANQVQKNDRCANRKIMVDGDILQEKVTFYQFVGSRFTYIVMPYINQKEKSSDRFKNEWPEIVRSFTIDSPIRPKPNVQEINFRKNIRIDRTE